MSGAYRDTGAAIERAEALEREVEELRAEIERLKATSNERRPNREPSRLPPDVEALENEVINLRAENELLRGNQTREGTVSEFEMNNVAAERDDLRREVQRLQNKIIDLKSRQHDEREPVDNRDAVIKRLTEERAELETELKEARDRYEAEPPASRDPKTFEEKVLAILNRLVK